MTTLHAGLTYIDGSGNALPAIEAHPDDLPESSLYGRPAPEGSMHLEVTLPDGRTALRPNVPEGTGPGTFTKAGAPSAAATKAAEPEPEPDDGEDEPEPEDETEKPETAEHPTAGTRSAERGRAHGNR